MMPHGCAAAAGSLTVQRTSDGLTWAAWPHRNQVCLLRLDGDQAETRTAAGRSADGTHSVLQVRDRLHPLCATGEGQMTPTLHRIQVRWCDPSAEY